MVPPRRRCVIMARPRGVAMQVGRRSLLRMMGGAATLSAIDVGLAASQETGKQVRVATGLLAMWQSTAWLGAEAGVFKKRGIDMTLPGVAIGGPQAASGVIHGDFEFAHTGPLPVAEEVLKGNDIVIL